MSDMSEIVRNAYSCEIAKQGTPLRDALKSFDGYFAVITTDGHLYSQESCRCATEHVDVFRTKKLAETEVSESIAPGFEVKKIGVKMREGLESYLAKKQREYNPTRNFR